MIYIQEYFFSRNKEDNYNGWFRFEELNKFLTNCKVGEDILDCLVLRVHLFPKQIIYQQI